jgi:hypothetical protein
MFHFGMPQVEQSVRQDFAHLRIRKRATMRAHFRIWAHAAMQCD